MLWSLMSAANIRWQQQHAATAAPGKHSLLKSCEPRRITPSQGPVLVMCHCFFMHSTCLILLRLCLQWSPDDRQLASGGNDNALLVWHPGTSSPVCRFCEHTAAVEAIAWSPHQHGLLASGGGTADRCIRFWNTTTNSLLNCVDTGSQVSI
eukprot:GHRR01031546.1.p1 GENE.GHRR01031546.1~~GHRR01031546.1.p1  ORF type:complete len:151 (-),score=44.95 GHRR01031546.1:544-996(-)